MTHRKIDISFNGCAGVYHPAKGDRGVVICAGHGYDELCTHRSFRLFAEDLAAADVPTLRFDYHGTGDSAGSDLDPARLETWIGNIVEAVAWLRQTAGVAEIALVGYRLGAALAALAAARLGTVGRLVLIAPVLSGKTYLRELALQSKLYPLRDEGEAGSQTGITSVGFVVSEETATALRDINLAVSGIAGVDKVCILSDSIKADSPLIVSLQEAGRMVVCLPFPHLADLSVDPIYSMSVNRPFAASIPFLTDNLATGFGRDTPTNIAAVEGPCWREEPVRFGPDGRLFGVLCRPLTRVEGAATLVIVNGGANHHIGWARMNVGWARELAAEGHATLRMDFSGLGESEAEDPAAQVILYDKAFQDDLAHGLDWLESQGFGNIAAIGACSGAQAVFQAAARDPRLAAVVMINLLRFDVSSQEARELGGATSFRSTANYLSLLAHPEKWRRIAAGGRRKIMAVLGEYGRRSRILLRSRLGNLLLAISGSPHFTIDVHRKFIAIARRTTRILIIYGDDDNGLEELGIHAGRRGRMLKNLPGIEMALIANTDHNLTAASARRSVINLIATFLRKQTDRCA